MNVWIWHIVVTAIMTCLIELVLHYLPWRMLLGRDLGRVASYSLGVLGLIAPWSVLAWPWSSQAVIALWSAVIAGGLAVAGAYTLDAQLSKLRLADELNEIYQRGHHGRRQTDE